MQHRLEASRFVRVGNQLSHLLLAITCLSHTVIFVYQPIFPCERCFAVTNADRLDLELIPYHMEQRMRRYAGLPHGHFYLLDYSSTWLAT
jgi:hypothetical protein